MLGLKVVAEDVETAHQSAFLHRHGCDFAQGFLYGHPCNAAVFRALIDARSDHSRLFPEDLEQVWLAG